MIRKRIISAIISFSFLISTFTVAASDKYFDWFIKIGDKIVPSHMYFENETLMLPLRDASEAFGAVVSYLPENDVASVKYKDVITLVPNGENTFYSNNLEATAKETSVINDGKLFVSLDLIETVFSVKTTIFKDVGIVQLDDISQTDTAETQNANRKLVNVVASEDTYVESTSKADTILNDGTTIGVKYVPNYGNTFRRAYVKFDVSGISVKDINRIAFECFFDSGEGSYTDIEFLVYAVDAEKWSESTLTFNTQPSVGRYLGSMKNRANRFISTYVTEYVKEQISLGKKSVAFAIDASSDIVFATKIASRRHPQSERWPKLVFDYTNLEEYEIFDDYIIPEYGKGIDPLENARQMLKTSTATYKNENVEDTAICKATESVQVSVGEPNTNFSTSKTMSVRYVHERSNNTQYSYMKFDLSDIKETQTGAAYLSVYCMSSGTTPRYVTLRELYSNSWNEENITWMNAPKDKSDVIGKYYVTTESGWIKFDITELINRCLKNKSKVISFVLDAYDQNATMFATGRQIGNEPKIVLMGIGKPEGSEEVKIKNYYHQYDLVVNDNKTRVLDSIKDYKQLDEMPPLSKYGGLLSKRVDNGTGFFRTAKIDGRWWIIDPEGYLFYSIGMNCVAYIKSNNEAQNVDDINNKYGGSISLWADEERKNVKKDGFNTLGGWSDFVRNRNPETGEMSGPLIVDGVEGEVSMPLCGMIYYGVGISYARTLPGDGSIPTGGQDSFKGGVPMVFNPDFEEVCNQIIRDAVTPWKDNPYIIGWWSDNEINESFRMLDDALNLDPHNILYTYTHAAAWEWLRWRTGRVDANIYDVNDVLREEFREYVYDRYYQVMSKAFKTYAPNHLFLGNRHMETAALSPGIFRAAARYCDIISNNLYHHWTPDVVDMWAGYVDKPAIITEWYANTDSVLGGFLVKTQEARGQFYENYTLRLLEAPNIVGWHWFQYVPYMNQYGETKLSESTQKINRNVYSLIEYFDK